MNNCSLFSAAVSNSREAASAVRAFKKQANHTLCFGSQSETRLVTNLSVILFSVWAECELLRLIYTPYGFTDSEICEILKQPSVEEKWKKILLIGMNRTHLDREGSLRSKFTPMLTNLIEIYIVGPAKLRNKIAHGQWMAAFNNSCTAINDETTKRLREVDLIEIERWHAVFKELSLILEDTIESPHRAFRRDSWQRIINIEERLSHMKGWTIESKRTILLPRLSRKGTV